MKPLTDSEQLLNDVLAEAAPLTGSPGPLQHLLQLAHQRRRRRQFRRAGAILMLLALFAAALRFPTASRKSNPELARPPAGSAGCEIVSSVALAPGQLITSQPLLPGQIAAAAPRLLIVQTTDANILGITDEELLKLAKPNIAVLVRRGPSEAELLFVSLPAGPN